MKIQHVILSHSDHILVVDGIRGPFASYGPATHPAGLIAYHPQEHTYGLRDFKGKTFRQVPADQVEVIEDTACEPAEAAFKQWNEIRQTCTEVKLSRYGDEAKEPA